MSVTEKNALIRAKDTTGNSFLVYPITKAENVDGLDELIDLIDTNTDAIDALETVAAGKADANHEHTISDVTGLQSALDGKAATSHGTHVSYSNTAPVMDGTASAGSASTVARSDHKHPTDTTRAAKTDLDSHTSNTTVHITSAERTNWNAAKTHADSAHAPSNAEKNQNAFSNIVVGSTTVAADTATDTLTLAGSNVTLTPDATNDKITFSVADGSTSAKGILQLTDSTSSTSTTTAATPKSVKLAYDLASTAQDMADMAQSTADGKANASHTHTIANVTNLQNSLNAKQATVTGGASTITSSNLTTDRVLVSNSSGKVAVSDVTSTELGYLSGITNDIQAQLDGKASSAHTHKYAGSSSAGGAATSANKLNTDAGDSNTPVYFSNGVPVACTSLDLNTTGSSASCTGNAATATKATQDGSGNVISDTYMVKNHPTGSGSFSMNRYPDSTIGAFSTALGYYSTASGRCSTAIGEEAEASGKYSLAIGEKVIASKNHAIAIGYNSTASGSTSVAIGDGATCTGSRSYSIGYETTATGIYSTAMGARTTASYFQLTTGKHNQGTSGPAGFDEQSSSNTDALFLVGYGTSSASANAFRVTSGGKCYGTTAFGASGADFAELFEWADGNPDNEDRRGLFVALDGEKIRIANEGDDYIGVISGAQAFIGNTASDEWQGKYLTDVFGDRISQEVEIPEVVDEETGEVITPATTAIQYVVNPDYDPAQNYTMRENRKEWGIVGLLGQIVMIDDGTCVVGGHVKPSANGIGTASDDGYRVMKRLDENHIKVLVK